MGGAAFLLACDVAPALFEEHELPRTLLDRLLFRTRTRGVTRMPLGASVHLDLPVPDEVKRLLPAFRAFIARALPRDDASARVILDEYLAAPVGEVYLRGEEQDGTTRTYVQLFFSGCAGLAEVSVAFVAHAAEHWWRRERAHVTSLLASSGVTPTDVCRFDDEVLPLFFPLKRGGYALFMPTPRAHDDDAERELDTASLEVDAALSEARGSMEDVDLEVQRLTPVARALLDDGHCRCALCAPDFRRDDTLSL